MIIDNKSKSLSYRLSSGLHLISAEFLNNLEKKKLKNLSIFRICLNSNTKNKFHQMIIFQKNTYIPTIKKELKKDKSFILLKGRKKIRIYNKNRKIIKSIYLDKSNFICWIPKNTFYDNLSLSKKTIHVESLAGPFNGDKNRVFL